MTNRGVYEKAAQLARRGEAFALATVVDAVGSVPGKLGAKMLVTEKGQSFGTVGGAGLEEKVKRLAMDALAQGKGRLERFELANWKEGGLDSVCGGSVTVSIEYSPSLPHLLLFGGGHVTASLARMLDELEYPYTVVDERPEFANAGRFPQAVEAFAGTPEAFLEGRDLSRYTHVLMLGHSHHLDTRALTLLAQLFDGRIGIIGSRSKRRSMLERAERAGAPRDRLEKVECPVGLDLGAETPGEIAIAIAAEILGQFKGARSPDRPVEERVLAGKGGTADAWRDVAAPDSAAAKRGPRADAHGV